MKLGDDPTEESQTFRVSGSQKAELIFQEIGQITRIQRVKADRITMLKQLVMQNKVDEIKYYEADWLIRKRTSQSSTVK